MFAIAAHSPVWEVLSLFLAGEEKEAVRKFLTELSSVEKVLLGRAFNEKQLQDFLLAVTKA